MDYESANGREHSTEHGNGAEPRAAALTVPALAGAAGAGALPLVAGPDGVIVLPAGVELDDIKVQGRDLVIQTDDGRTFVIPDGAVFVPTLVIDGVTVPPLNLAALLNGLEIQPAAGNVPSSGGNFADPVGDIQDAYKLGNLLPYTEFGSSLAPRVEVLPGFVNHSPTIDIITPVNQTPVISATATVQEKGLPPHNALPAGSGEIADGNPNNNSDTSETTNGTIVLDSPDGVQSVTLSGTPITQVGQVITGSFGTVTITSIDIAGGTIGFSYNQTTNTTGDATHDDFVVQVVDPQGDTATAMLMVNIVDDVPDAINDIDSVAAGTTGPATGNVITGSEVAVAEDSNATDGVPDVPGADGARVSFIDNSQNAAPGAAVAAGGSTSIAGQFGTLTIFANGDYTYARNPGQGGGQNEVFTYTLLDGDGDSDTATLTIAIGDGTPTITGLTPQANGGDALVDEDDLPTGSDTAKESLTGTGDFTITSPDGVANLSIGGHQVIANGVFTATSWTSPLGNTMSITGYNAATGVVSYGYTLTAAETHANANGENNLFEDFAVSLTDLDGDPASSTLSVKIVDDVPDAIDDFDTVAGGTSIAATGNLITGTEVAVAEDSNATDGVADVPGADGARISFIDNSQDAAVGLAVSDGGFTDIAGLYGVLRVWSNGDYLYVRSPNTPGGGTEVFSYTLLDADGDSDTANLTIAIGNVPPQVLDVSPHSEPGNVGIQLIVDEDDLPNGSDTSKESLTDTHSVAIPSFDGVATLVVDGHTIIQNGVFTAASWSTPLGNIISITAYNPNTQVVTYSYTLTGNEAHANGAGENDLFEALPVTVTDLDGQVGNGTLTARIIDDVPDAINDTDAVAAGSTGPATGNVITGVEVAVSEDSNSTDGVADVQGADGARVSFIDNSQDGAAGAIVTAGGSTSIAGQFGTLTIFANGDYSYARTPGLGGGQSEVFTYTLLDGDGDTDTATLTINIGDSVPLISGLTPEAQGGDVSVDEDDLADGSDPAPKDSLTGTGNFTITSPDGVATLVIGGHTVITGGVFTAASWTTPLGNTISVTGFNPGTGVVTYTYTLGDNENHPNGNGENNLFESFSVQVTDTDGDPASDTLVARIVDDVPTGHNDTDSVAAGTTGPATGNVLTGSEVAVAEDGNATDGVADVQGADGARISFIDNSQNVAAGVVVPSGGSTSIAGQYGTLTIYANGDYSYARTPGQGGGQNEIFTYTLLDGDGDTATATLTISIGDSPPVIRGLTPAAQGGDVIVDEDDLADGSDPAPKDSLTGNGDFTIAAPDGVASLVIGGHTVITGGVFTADSWTTPLGNTISITGYNAGTGVVSYTYTLLDNENHPNGGGQNDLFENFTVVLTDTDGDPATDTLVARIVDDVPTGVNDTDSIDAGTTGPATGNVLTGSEVAVAEDGNATDGVADVQGADGARISFIDNSQDAALGTAVAAGGSASIAGQYGTLTIYANGDYSYDRTPGQGGGHSEVFTYTLLDGDGDTATATLTIDIGDSTPRISDLVPEARGGDVSVDEDDLSDGSDPAPKDSLTGTGDFTITSPDGVGSLVIGGHTVITGGVFTADSWITPLGNTISITGYNAGTGVVTYTYTLGDNENHPTANGENNLFESFTVQLTDLDGDPASDTLVARIVDDVPTAVNDGTYSVAENTPLTFDVLANDIKGADGVDPVTGMFGFTQPPVGEGTVAYNNDGTFTFTPPPSGTFFGPTSFTYTIVDGDGDQSTATVNVNVARDSTPQILQIDTVTVDEDGFANANVDGAPLQGSPQEVDSNELLVNTGSIVINFGADVPSNPLATANMHLVDTAGLDTQLKTLDGNAVTFALSGGDLVGTGTGGEVVRIHLASYVLGPNPGDVTYTYQVTLSQPIKHATAGTEDTAILTGVTFAGQDSDGSTFQSTLDVHIVDDVPSLSLSDTPNTVIEGQLLNTGTWDQTIGADAAGATTKVVFNAVEYNLDTNIVTGLGTLRVNSNGTWTFQANSNVNNSPSDPTVAFTVKVTDGDLDVAQDSLTITITDGADPSATKNADISVDEEGLNTANAVGTNPGANSENGSDTVTFHAGSDNIVSVAFENPLSGLTADINGVPGNDIVWVRDSGTVIRGEIGGITAITLTLTPPSLPITPGNTASATVSVVLADNFPHPDASGENVINITGLSVVATDTDNDTASATVAVHITDDVPTLSVSDTPATVVEGQLLNTGTWAHDTGADSAGAVTKVIVSSVEYNLDTAINTGFGTLQVNSNGTWTFQANSNVNNNPDPTVTFTVRLTDGDGDVAQDTQIITITDGANPSATKNADISVDEEGLGTVNATGTNSAANSENGSDTVTFHAGSDNIVSVKFAADISGMTADVNGIAGNDVTWLRVDDTHITGTIGGITAITITLTPPSLPITPGNSGNATVSVVIADNFPHPDGAGENVIDITGLSVVAADTDNDTASATVAIHVKDDVPVNNSATVTAAVQEDALNNANAKGNNAGEGAKTVNASFTAASIAALVVAGADSPVALAFNSTTLDGTATGLFQNGTSIDWDYVSTTQVRGLVGNDSTKVAFTLTWNAGTQSYDFVLLDNIDHGTLADNNGDAFTTSLDLANVFTATDTDGDKITIDAGASVTIENDIPTLGTVQSQLANNNPIQAPAVGTLHLSPGADGVGTITVTANLAGITSGGHVLTALMTGSNVLTGFYDADSSGTLNGAETAVFTLTVNPAAGTSGQYVFDLMAPLDGSIVDTAVGGTTSFGAGPQPYQYLSQTSVAVDPLALISGWQTGAGFNAATWYAGSSTLPVTGVTLAAVNGSTSGWGVDSNTFTAGEFMRFDFGAFNDFDGAGAYNPPAPAVALPNISYAKFDMIGMSGADTAQFVVHNTDGTTSHQTWTSADTATGYQVSATLGKTIAWIDVLSNAAGGAKIDLQNVGVQSTVVDSTIPFTLTIKDGDGDVTATQPFTVHVKDGLSPDLPVAPIVLDLDGNGVDLASRAAGHTFDYSGDGHAEATAWAGKGDGILAIDLDGDGKVTHAAEFVFGSNGQTDLQGLTALYDTNHDGVLDTADARFADFGVWKGDGSFQSLGDAGIASISLVSNGVGYTAADGDVTVHGTTTFTKADGSTGTAADATFATGDSQVMGALLDANAPQSGAAPTPPAPVDEVKAAVIDALADSHAANAIDAVVDHFAANDVGSPADAGTAPPPVDTGALLSLLNATVDAANDHGPPPMAMAHIDDQSAALAAAAA